MDWPSNYVYVPLWLLLLLVFLASGALQYGLVAAVRWVVQRERERERERIEAQVKLRQILRIDRDRSA